MKCLVSRVVGFFLPLIFDMQVVLDADSMVEKAFILLMTLGLVIFLEYQLFNSRKNGEIYFRGIISSSDSFSFNSAQISYAVMSGFIVSYILLLIVK